MEAEYAEMERKSARRKGGLWTSEGTESSHSFWSSDLSFSFTRDSELKFLLELRSIVLPHRKKRWTMAWHSVALNLPSTLYHMKYRFADFGTGTSFHT